MSTATTNPDSGESNVLPFEFGKPAQLSAEKMNLYREAASQIAIDAETALQEWLPGCSIEADPLTEVEPGVDLLPDEEGFDCAPITGATSSCGVLAVELQLGLMLVGGTLGGASAVEIEARPLTSIEVRVLDLISNSMLAAACRTLLLDDVVIERGRGDGFQAGDDDRPRARVGFNFGVQGLGERKVMMIGFDVDALQRFSDAIDLRLSGRQITTPIDPSPLTELALRPVPVHLTVGVGKARLTAREVVELQVGDVIRTRVPVTADLIASAGTTDLFEVRLAQRGNQLVAEVLSPVTPEND